MLLLLIIVIVEPSELLLLRSEIILILIIVKATKIIAWLLLGTELTLTIILVVLLLSVHLLLGSMLLVLVLLLAIAHLLLISESLILLISCLELVLLEALSEWITLILLWCCGSELTTAAHIEEAWVWYEALWLLWFCSLLLLCLWSIEVEGVASSLLLTVGSSSEGAIVFGAIVVEEIQGVLTLGFRLSWLSTGVHVESTQQIH